MKFTEALLLGSMNSQQAFHMNTGDNFGRCALETAVETTGGNIKGTFSWQKAMIIWPWLNTKVEAPEVLPNWFNKEMMPIFEIIYGLNDIRRWPRPRIAEWVKPYEALYDVPVTQPVVESTLVTR